MTDIPEQWKPYDDVYWVSDQGRVKRIYKNGRVNYLNVHTRFKGDKQLRVKIRGKYVSLRRLVWETFVGKVPDGYGVVNKNKCYTMNDLYNLELMPLSECKSIGNHLRRKKVINLDTGIVYPSAREAGKHLYISKSAIVMYCNDQVLNPSYNLEYYDEDKNYKKSLHFVRS